MIREQEGFIITDLCFRLGHPRGQAKVVSIYRGLVVLPCQDPSCPCGGLEQKIEDFNPYPVTLELSGSIRSGRETKFYIAHFNPAPVASIFEDQFRTGEINLGELGIKLTFLGSLEAGAASCVLLSYQDTAIMIDCGVTVAQLEADTDLDEITEADGAVPPAYPDFNLINPATSIKAILITHAHLDHYGGIAEFLSRGNHSPTIYGHDFTTAMVTRQFDESQLYDKIRLIQRISAGEMIEIGHFKIKAFPVCHSVPGSFGYAIWLCGHEDESAIVFSGDFKGRQKDTHDLFETIETLRNLGPCRLFVGDSLNTDRQGFTRLESSVDEGLLNCLYHAPGRVFISLFSTQLYRLRELSGLAHLMGTQLAIVGSSFEAPLGSLDAAGITLNYTLEPNETTGIIAIAGCQANDTSVSWRLSQGETVKGLRINPNDTVVLSASAIPGRIGAIIEMLRNFRNLGARVIIDEAFPRTMFGFNREAVHVSGHGSAADIAATIEALQPKYFVPYHCGQRQAIAAADLASQGSVISLRDDHIILIREQGTIINL